MWRSLRFEWGNMGAVIPARSSRNPSIVREDLGISSRPPLNPSEKDNAAVSRRPKTKDVTSRYLSSFSSPSSSTTSTSSSSSARTGATSTSSSSSSSSFRRCPSPLPSSSRPSTPSTLPKRSQSVDRTRPATPRSVKNSVGSTESSAAKSLCTTTRSLSVSFQGGSYFYQTSKAKNTALNSGRKPTPERRTSSTTPQRSNKVESEGRERSDHHLENSRPGDHLRWPAARSKQFNPLSRSLDYSEKRDSMVPSARLLQQSMRLDEGRRMSFDVGELSASSDTDSVSSGSNSGAYELSAPRSHASSRGSEIPARFWKENSGRLRRLPDFSSPIAAPLSRTSSTSKLYPVRKSFDGSPLSPITSSKRPSSPNRVAPLPLRAISSPLRMRNNGQALGQTTIAPSMIEFATDLRRSRKGELRIEDAHLLRLLHNRHLQWRYVNARASSSISLQKSTAEVNICIRQFPCRFNNCIYSLLTGVQ